ncbi:hypothetical protein E1218_19765 [Kribbella turkmenica]|uniref:Uncharacterized protein n=1 Tax=Kribbella turkmenica TaxID=2530375 RepID=A0A4R4WWY3_9ACTN|nr:hypothetical protein [Kribbella turkmenica]TDD22192.1 hypothetical protein E1218_19765 [Kribbella turkmenica]
MTRARTALAACGIVVGLWGLWLLLGNLSADQLIRLPLWLGGAVVVDDFFLVPLTIGAGWLLTRRLTGHTRAIVRTMLLYVGITTLIATPLLLRQGKGINPTVLPRDYLRDWLVLEATIVLAGVLALVVQRLRRADGSAGSRLRTARRF